jgi:DNA-binding winged helix-turn-helix (wHTH) protein
MPGTLRFDCFEVDLAAHELYKRGARIRLRDQSFQVLTLLLEHPGRVVTREDLRHRLWTEDVFVDFENGLNTAVARLREALSDSADRPRYIETLPRVGYRFIAPVVATAMSSQAPAAPAPKARLVVLPFVASSSVRNPSPIVPFDNSMASNGNRVCPGWSGLDQLRPGQLRQRRGGSGSRPGPFEHTKYRVGAIAKRSRGVHSRGALRDARPRVNSQHLVDELVLAEIDVGAGNRRQDRFEDGSGARVIARAEGFRGRCFGV